MSARPEFRKTLLSTAVVLAALSTAVGCGGGGGGTSSDTTRLDDIEAVGTSTLFPGTGDEKGEDIDFPSAAVGKPAAVDVEVRNTTDKPMKVKDVAVSGVEVSDDKCSGETVPSGESCTFRVVKPADEDGTDGTKEPPRHLTVTTDLGSVTSAMRTGQGENGDTETTPAESLTPTDVPTEPTDVPTEPTDVPTEPTDVPTEPTDVPTEPTDAPTEPTDVPTVPTVGPEARLPDSPGTSQTAPAGGADHPRSLPSTSTRTLASSRRM
ncbi:hypothetical protein [Streptomyces kanamyceticus]|uniref:hypothetical protein n=1 Tax=Streptomyces kanamyceticus TaxID=1967 RepID=UPI0037DD8BA1